MVAEMGREGNGMKVQDLRNLLSEADRKRMEKAFVECYKAVPKGKKEELDELIAAIFEGGDEKKVSKKENVDYEALEREINVFVENAYAQNYFVPNRVIPKSQRPKWRFLVKNYIKQLEKVPAENEYSERMVKLLRDLYHMLCYGCNYYIFSTDDPFRSVGWEQPKLFLVLVKKTFSTGYSKENIKQMVQDACTGGLSTESLHIENMICLLGELKTSDVKFMAIEAAKELAGELENKLKALKKYDSGRYYMEEAIDNYCGMVLMISIQLAEKESGTAYFFSTSKESDKEITLYKALDYVDYVGEDETWKWVYEYGVKKKIKPRKSLTEEYERIKREENGET